MRLLTLLLASLLSAPAHASHIDGPADTPPGYEFVMPAAAPTSGRPFYVEVHRTGQWIRTGLTTQAIINGNNGNNPLLVSFNVSLDGRIIFTSTMAEFAMEASWIVPLAWGMDVPGLPEGQHEFAATYAGDSLNPSVTSTLAFTVLPYQFVLNPPRRPKPLEPLPDADPDVSPGGVVFLTNEETGAVAVVDIATLLVTDPETGKPRFDLSSLQADTVISYPGDANFPAFNFTYDALETPVPAPAAPFALALLALATLRRRARPATLGRRLRGSPCRTPISSTCASTPPIR